MHAVMPMLYGTFPASSSKHQNLTQQVTDVKLFQAVFNPGPIFNLHRRNMSVKETREPPLL